MRLRISRMRYFLSNGILDQIKQWILSAQERRSLMSYITVHCRPSNSFHLWQTWNYSWFSRDVMPMVNRIWFSNPLYCSFFFLYPKSPHMSFMARANFRLGPNCTGSFHFLGIDKLPPANMIKINLRGKREDCIACIMFPITIVCYGTFPFTSSVYYL